MMAGSNDSKQQIHTSKVHTYYEWRKWPWHKVATVVAMPVWGSVPHKGCIHSRRGRHTVPRVSVNARELYGVCLPQAVAPACTPCKACMLVVACMLPCLKGQHMPHPLPASVNSAIKPSHNK
jgi:hypothetical protein